MIPAKLACEPLWIWKPTIPGTQRHRPRPNSWPDGAGNATCIRRPISAFEVVFDPFQSLFDLVPVMKNVVLVVMVLVLKFGDHRRWLESERVQCTRAWRRVRCSLAAGLGPKIIIFDYGHVGVYFLRFWRSLGFYIIVYRSVTERRIFKNIV